MALTNPTECPYYLITRVSLLVTSKLKKGFVKANVGQVKPAYLGVLMILWRDDGLKMIDLGRKAGLEPSTMTGLLDRMERDGLVKRTADPQDRRAQRIYLTKEGHQAHQPIIKVVEYVLSKVFNGVSQEDLMHTKHILRQVLINARKGIQ